MIALFIIALIACAIIGYKTADVVADLWKQHTMNTWRRELELPVRPYAIRIKTNVTV